MPLPNNTPIIDTMIIDFKIEEKDFLIYQLYAASKSERIKKTRRRSKIVAPLIYVIVGFMFFFPARYSTAIILFIIGLLWFFIYPLWEKGHYVRHYRHFIKENYKDRFGRTATLEFNNDFILERDNGSESRILTTEVEEINEISTMIFIKLKGGQSVILPKDKIADIDQLTTRLKELSIHLRIKYNIDEQWKWK